MYAGSAYAAAPYAGTSREVTPPAPVSQAPDQIHGLLLECIAYLEVTVPVAPVPAGVVLGEAFDVVIPYPTPTLVDGRPT